MCIILKKGTHHTQAHSEVMTCNIFPSVLYVAEKYLGQATF